MVLEQEHSKCLSNYVTVKHRSWPRRMGWMYPGLLPHPPRPDGFNHKSSPNSSASNFFSNFEGNRYFFFFFFLYTPWNNLNLKKRMKSHFSAVSFLKDDFIPESVVFCTGHTVAGIKEVYFYACWMMYKRNIFQRFPSPCELAIHNDWNRGERIPKPSSFKSRGIHATYESVIQEEQEPRHLCDLAETDPFYQNTGNRKTWIIWSHCIWWAYTLSHNRTCPALLLSMKSSVRNWSCNLNIISQLAWTVTYLSGGVLLWMGFYKYIK